MSALRIGQFTDSFPPVINGVSTFVSEHHAELLSRSQAAHVFTFGYARHVDRDANIWRSKGWPLGTSQFRMGWRLSAQARRVADTLDVLHAHEAIDIGHVAAFLVRLKRRPLIFTNHTRHDLYVLNYPRVLQPMLLRFVSRNIASFIRSSTLTTAPSHDSVRWLQSLAPDAADRIRVVRNGIRLDAFDRPPDRALRATLGIPEERTVFIYVGRVTPEKNLMAFADALILAVNQGADAHWVVIGDGQSSAALEAKVAPIQSRVSLLGAMPRDHIQQYLTMADVFATTSFSEVNPVSVIEAMACGKPYLGLQAAWWDEFADDTDPEPAGILTRNDPLELAAAIQRLCADHTLHERMGARARCLSRRFDIRVVTSQWLEVYREIVEDYH
jgi:glycosyltransferase involved in cell wall biosynthesis